METEKWIEKNLKQFVESQGGICYKFVSPGRSKVPDRLCVLPGNNIYFTELKGTYKDLPSGQRRELIRLKRMDCKAYCINTVQKLEAFKMLVYQDMEAING